MLTPALIARLYDYPAQVIHHPETGQPRGGVMPFIHHPGWGSPPWQCDTGRIASRSTTIPYKTIHHPEDRITMVV